MSPFAVVGFSALAVVVVGWLVISFTAAGPRRAVVEWLCATALYVALCSLFGHLVRRAWLEDSMVALIAFGLLLVIFSGGCLVSFANALLSLRGAAKAESSATN